LKKQNKPLTDETRDYVAEVHGRTRKHVERYSRTLMQGNTADAQDLTQETYARFSRRVGNNGPLEENRPEKPYLLATAKHAKSNLRRDNRLRITTLHGEAEGTGDAQQDKEASRVAEKRVFQDYAAGVRRTTYVDRFKHLIPIIQSKPYCGRMAIDFVSMG